MDKKLLITELIARLKAEKPEFFRKLQKWSLLIAGIIIVVAYVVQYFAPGFATEIISKLINASWYIISFVSGGVIVAQATTTNAALQDDKTKQNILKSASINDLTDAKSK